MEVTGTIESRDDYEDDEQGQYQYWMDELTGSLDARKNWHRQGAKIVNRYLDGRSAENDGVLNLQRLNLFNSNITTLMSMLYGNVPKVDVSRRFADPNDDISRVAAEIMERILNNDIEANGDDYNSVLRGVLQDRLLAGLGCARVRYEVETEVEMVASLNAEGVTVMVEQERVIFEDAPVDYVHWQDILWGWGRTWKDIAWLGYRSWLNKDEVTARFGKDVARNLTFKRQTVNDDRDIQDDADTMSVWQKAEIWEIWDKVSRKVYWISKGYDKVLDVKDDPLQLSNFFPSPAFMLANPTTSLYAPTPDFHLSRDLYNEIDVLQTRITIITKAIKVVGLYDSACGDSIGRMLQEGTDNQLIPVDSWALFAEKGGIAGSVQWMPLQDIVGALDKLREMRDETIQLLYQVTGMADIMRGTTSGQYEGVGQSELKAKFGSVRVQALQDSFAKFASDLLQIKAEIISRHFSPENIALVANIENSFDRELAPQAIGLIKDPALARLRVVIRPESVAMVDYAQLKQERTEYISAIALFMQSAAPLFEQDPSLMPFLLQMLQWGLAGFKGSSEIEGVVDRAIEAAQKAADNQKQQPDPAQQQLQMQQELEQIKMNGEMQKIQAKAQADMQTRAFDRQADIETSMAEHRSKMVEIEAEMFSEIARTKAKMEADLALERAQMQANLAQTVTTAQAEVDKDTVTTELEIQKEQVKTALKIDEMAMAAAAKMREQSQAKKDGE